MSTSRPLKFAVVGCGAVAEIHHLPAIAASRRAETVALVDVDIDRARRLADRFGVRVATVDLDAAAAEADAAVVAVPNHLHAPIAVDLLERGVHVLVEKPMALSVERCDEMIAAAERTGCTLGVGLEFRQFQGLRWTAEALASELIGELRGFDLRQGVVPEWPYASDYVLDADRAGGGVLVDFGGHILDLLLWWFGDVDEIAYRDDARGGVESNCEIELVTASGVGGRVELSRTRTLANTCRIEGERGILEVEIWDPDPEVSLTLHGGTTLDAHVPLRSGARMDFPTAMRRQIDDFAIAVVSGEEPAAGGAVGRAVVALIERCYAERRRLDYPWERSIEAGVG